MPGIAGFTSTSLEPAVAEKALRGMRDLMTHHDSYQRDALFSDGSVCGTRTHLGIIQKEAQPYNESGIFVWLDGELYNRREVAARAGVRADSDPALLLSLYGQDRSLESLEEVDGIYSAVIYDSFSRTVHLVTDRYGLRDLYWTVSAGRLAWASEVKAMLALPWFTPVIDRQAVDQFLAIGYLLENRTWFEGVELLPTGSVITWDIENRSNRKKRYWWWDRIKPMRGKIDETEIAGELGRVFTEAVQRRSGPGARIGMTLSGGLDSRAILAAIPDPGYTLNTVTFGKEGCSDVRIARVASEVKGASHHTCRIDPDNWLPARLGGVWWTDGMKDLMHMHSIGALGLMRELFEVNMNGFVGDVILGWCYLRLPLLPLAPRLFERSRKMLDNPDRKLVALFMHCDPSLLTGFEDYSRLRKTDYYLLDNRVRRFIGGGAKLLLTTVEDRKPFLDNKLVELAYSLPDSLRFRNKIYRTMLLQAFPDYFRDIPYQKTGVPISRPQAVNRAMGFYHLFKNKISPKMSRLGINIGDPGSYTDYPAWIRREPAVSLFKKVLNNRSAIYPEFIPREEVEGRLEKHMSGQDFSKALCRYLTFEVWLQQVFEGRYRETGWTGQA